MRKKAEAHFCSELDGVDGAQQAKPRGGHSGCGPEATLGRGRWRWKWRSRDRDCGKVGVRSRLEHVVEGEHSTYRRLVPELTGGEVGGTQQRRRQRLRRSAA